MSYPTDAIATQSTGHGVTAADWDELVDALNAIRAGTVALRAVVATAITAVGTQNNLMVPAGRFVIQPLNNASLITITGIAPASAAQDGDIIEFVAANAEADFSHQAGGSTAANRMINLLTSGVTPCAGGTGSIAYRFDADARNSGANPRWRLMRHEQGAWIAFTPTQAVASGGGTITTPTQSGYFYVKGTTMLANVRIQGTPTATVDAVLVTLPNGYTTRKPVNNADAPGYFTNGTPGTPMDSSLWKVNAVNGTQWAVAALADNGIEVSYNTGAAYDARIGNVVTELN